MWGAGLLSNSTLNGLSPRQHHELNMEATGTQEENDFLVHGYRLSDMFPMPLLSQRPTIRLPTNPPHPYWPPTPPPLPSPTPRYPPAATPLVPAAARSTSADEELERVVELSIIDERHRLKEGIATPIFIPTQSLPTLHPHPLLPDTPLSQSLN